MKYNRELNELLLNFQRLLRNKQVDNVTIDKKALSENVRIKREATIIGVVIKNLHKRYDRIRHKKDHVD